MSLLRLTLFHLRRYWPWVVAVLLFQLGVSGAMLWLPSLNAQIIDEGIAKGDLDFIVSTGAVMLAVALGHVAASLGAVFSSSRTAMGLGRDLRRRIFRRVQGLAQLETTEFGAGTLITRGTNDVQQVQMLVMMTLNFTIITPIMMVGSIIMALREDAGLSWLVWVSVALLAAVVITLVRKLMPLFRGMQNRVDDINSVLREQIMGIRVVRAFVRERFEAERFREANDALTGISVRVGNLFVLMFPLIMMIMHVATGSVLWFGGHRVDSGLVEVGSLIAFMQYLMHVLISVMLGVFMAMMVPRALVSAERITELLKTTPSIVFPEEATAPTPSAGRLEFRDVSFGFPGAERSVLQNVSFVAEPGQTTAIIGSTGSGKSTLLNLALRLFDADEGEITLDGEPLQRYTREQLSAALALVPQRPYLFSGTIASNLRFGNAEATDEDLWGALRVAQAECFVRDKDGRLEEPVAQGGTSVSGGQRQRLSIARALIAKPRVYLFDDSFSALDVATDARLRAALPEATGGATMIVVAQRVSSITGADQILVIDDGRIVDRGTHDELLHTSAIYQEIVHSQLDSEGVA